MFDEISMISRTLGNKIIGTSFDEYEIIFLVSEITDEQSKIPSVIGGRAVKVLLES